MKKSIFPFCAGFFAVIIIYLAFAYGNWQMNPGKWDPMIRCFSAIFGLAGFAYAFIVTHWKIEDKKNG